MIYARRPKQKFGNKKTAYDGYSFASKFEASVYQQLKLRERAGEIRIDQVQDHCYLTEARIPYVADFRCVDLKSDKVFWVEAKGFETPAWKIKLRLWKSYGPGVLEIWKGTWVRPVLTETVIPRNSK